MARSQAATVEEYLAELPAERREVISAIRQAITRKMPKGYQETMNWGMISYEVPLSRFSETYNKQPLGFLGLAAQKNHYALYMMCAYPGTPHHQALQEAFEKAGKKLDMGKSCIRFKKLEDIPLDAIARLISKISPKQLIEWYQKVRDEHGKGSA